MARSTNRQLRSVGNLGDILKHAALVELAAMLRHTPATVTTLDTHAFLLHAPLADGERWNREVDELVSRHPAYARYAALEREALARTQRYRCSSGLVTDQLGDGRFATTLGEIDGETRAELREQVAEEGLANVVVADDAMAALRDAATRSASSLLVHVDPFSLSPALWSSLAPGLASVCAQSLEAVIVVYRYTRNAPSAWPDAPGSMLGPIAQIRGGPHEIAAYASARITEEVRAVCEALGWRVEATR